MQQMYVLYIKYWYELEVVQYVVGGLLILIQTNKRFALREYYVSE